MRKVHAVSRGREILPICLTVALIFLALGLQQSQRMLSQTTYVITDGGRVLVRSTSAVCTDAVLGEAGLELGADDAYTTDTTEGVSTINIRRGQKLRVNYYGKMLDVTSQGETVEALLSRLKLPWHEGDVISAPLDAQTYDGMELTVAHVVQKNQTYTEALKHETIRISDCTLPEGTEKVITPGADGELLCSSVVTYINGEETERVILSRQVVSQPVRRVIAVGTGAAQQKRQDSNRAVIGNGTITLPTGEVLTYTEKVTCLATAYHCEGYVGKTATGTRARVGAIAVDPEVFPYGTRFYIVSRDGEYVYGVATAEDCGDRRFIHDTRLDLFFNTKYECIQFGARSCDVYILG